MAAALRSRSEDEEIERVREERDESVARTLAAVRAQVEVLKLVTSSLADALDGLNEE